MLKVNLQPKMVSEAKEGFQLPVWAPILIGLLVVFGCGGAYWYININVSNLSAQQKSNEYKLKDFQGMIKDAAVMKADRDYLKTKQDFISKISTGQAQWKYFFDMLKDNMPRDVWIDNLSVDRSGDMKISGSTYSYGAIGNFIIHLEAMPQLSAVTLDEAGQKASQNAGGGGASQNQGNTPEDTFKITAKSEMVSPPEQKKPAPAKRAAAQ